MNVLRHRTGSNAIESSEIDVVGIEDREKYISEAEDGIRFWFAKTLEKSTIAPDPGN